MVSQVTTPNDLAGLAFGFPVKSFHNNGCIAGPCEELYPPYTTISTVRAKIVYHLGGVSLVLNHLLPPLMQESPPCHLARHVDRLSCKASGSALIVQLQYTARETCIPPSASTVTVSFRSWKLGNSARHFSCPRRPDTRLR
ncbi:hypothetical protein BDW22DRAFT_706162 [Trametopsis cervina]|nr:hypothetical protein BDW22DRAFT_706162 [Trametopsis cervina]